MLHKVNNKLIFLLIIIIIVSIISGTHIESYIDYEDNDVIAFNDISPQAPIHVLVVPKKEIRTLNDVSDDDKEIIGKIFIAAKKIAKKLNIDKTGYRTIFKNQLSLISATNHFLCTYQN